MLCYLTEYIKLYILSFQCFRRCCESKMLHQILISEQHNSFHTLVHEIHPYFSRSSLPNTYIRCRYLISVISSVRCRISRCKMSVLRRRTGRGQTWRVSWTPAGISSQSVQRFIYQFSSRRRYEYSHTSIHDKITTIETPTYQGNNVQEEIATCKNYRLNITSNIPSQLDTVLFVMNHRRKIWVGQDPRNTGLGGRCDRLPKSRYRMQNF